MPERALPVGVPGARAYAGLAIGLGLFTAVVAYEGVREVTWILASAGPGLLWLPAFHLVPLLASALGWYAILTARTRPSLRTFTSARWIAESINQLLPAFQVGGNVVRAQRLARHGVAGPIAGASVIVDITLHLVAQLLFMALGLGLLLLRAGHRGFDGLDGSLVAALVLATAMVGAFFATQRRGVFGALASLMERALSLTASPSLSSDGQAMDAWVRRLYENGRALGRSLVWHFLSWLLGSGEVWLALRLLGHPVDLGTAVIIESAAEAIRMVAFAIPGALGMQEGGLLLVCGQFGLAPEVAVALSLAKRIRELSLGIPGLIAWRVGGSRSKLAPHPDAAPRRIGR